MRSAAATGLEAAMAAVAMAKAEEAAAVRAAEARAAREEAARRALSHPQIAGSGRCIQLSRSSR